MPRSVPVPLVALAAALLAACAAQPVDPVAEGAQAARERAAGSALQLSAWLETLQRLAQGSPAEQAEIFSAARLAQEQTPGGAAQLRYALALATPSHPARDPVVAQRLLREVLATPETLTPAERALAYLELQRVDVELRLSAENKHLVDEAQRNLLRERNALASNANRRLQTEIDENARLRKALDEAQGKLDAIANIERKITDRKPPAPEVRKP